MNNDIQLREALSKLSDASELRDTEEYEERARVRRARASVTEHARKTGDSVGTLLSGLMDDSNAEIEAEKAEKARKSQEAEAQAKAKREAEEAKKREEAQNKLEEEKRRLEEKEQRRLQMIAEMEKQRKREAGIVDEEEEAEKRRQAEAKAAREAAEKAREAAEEAQLLSSNEELADQIRIIKAQQAHEAQIAADKKHKKEMLFRTAIAAAILIIGGIVAYYFATLKAPDYYRIMDDYETKAIAMTNNIPKADIANISSWVVEQENPNKTVIKKHHPTHQKTDDKGIKFVKVDGSDGKITF